MTNKDTPSPTVALTSQWSSIAADVMEHDEIRRTGTKTYSQMQAQNEKALETLRRIAGKVQAAIDELEAENAGIAKRLKEVGDGPMSFNDSPPVTFLGSVFATPDPV